MKRFLPMTLVLLGCFNPDFTQKTCTSDSACPTERGYSCVAGRCAQDGSNAVVDMAPDPRPVRVEVEVRGTGSFYMGAMATDGISDTPTYIRNVPNPYFLDEREVTVADYRACVTAQVCTAPVTGLFGAQGWVCTYGRVGKDTHPVTCVTKTQAEAFCTWMGRRLPTEVEWEYAALGNTGMSGQRLVFPGAIGGNACWNTNATCLTGSYSNAKTYLGQVVTADQPGFYDLLGNVWERTSSSFCTYPAETCTTDKFSIRGGSGFDNDVRFSKATARLPSPAAEYYPNIGFRCARDSKP